jgi:hypothetical protein
MTTTLISELNESTSIKIIVLQQLIEEYTAQFEWQFEKQDTIKSSEYKIVDVECMPGKSNNILIQMRLKGSARSV